MLDLQTSLVGRLGYHKLSWNCEDLSYWTSSERLQNKFVTCGEVARLLVAPN